MFNHEGFNTLSFNRANGIKRIVSADSLKITSTDNRIIDKDQVKNDALILSSIDDRTVSKDSILTSDTLGVSSTSSQFSTIQNTDFIDITTTGLETGLSASIASIDLLTEFNLSDVRALDKNLDSLDGLSLDSVEDYALALGKLTSDNGLVNTLEYSDIQVYTQDTNINIVSTEATQSGAEFSLTDGLSTKAIGTQKLDKPIQSYDSLVIDAFDGNAMEKSLGLIDGLNIAIDGHGVPNVPVQGVDSLLVTTVGSSTPEPKGLDGISILTSEFKTLDKDDNAKDQSQVVVNEYQSIDKPTSGNDSLSVSIHTDKLIHVYSSDIVKLSSIEGGEVATLWESQDSLLVSTYSTKIDKIFTAKDSVKTLVNESRALDRPGSGYDNPSLSISAEQVVNPLANDYFIVDMTDTLSQQILVVDNLLPTINESRALDKTSYLNDSFNHILTDNRKLSQDDGLVSIIVSDIETVEINSQAQIERFANDAIKVSSTDNRALDKEIQRTQSVGVGLKEIRALNKAVYLSELDSIVLNEATDLSITLNDSIKIDINDTSDGSVPKSVTSQDILNVDEVEQRIVSKESTYYSDSINLTVSETDSKSSSSADDLNVNVLSEGLVEPVPVDELKLDLDEDKTLDKSQTGLDSLNIGLNDSATINRSSQDAIKTSLKDSVSYVHIFAQDSLGIGLIDTRLYETKNDVDNISIGIGEDSQIVRPASSSDVGSYIISDSSIVIPISTDNLRTNISELNGVLDVEVSPLDNLKFAFNSFASIEKTENTQDIIGLSISESSVIKVENTDTIVVDSIGATGVAVSDIGQGYITIDEDWKLSKPDSDSDIAKVKISEQSKVTIPTTDTLNNHIIEYVDQSVKDLDSVLPKIYEQVSISRPRRDSVKTKINDNSSVILPVEDLGVISTIESADLEIRATDQIIVDVVEDYQILANKSSSDKLIVKDYSLSLVEASLLSSDNIQTTCTDYYGQLNIVSEDYLGLSLVSTQAKDAIIYSKDFLDIEILDSRVLDKQNILRDEQIKLQVNQITDRQIVASDALVTTLGEELGQLDVKTNSSDVLKIDSYSSRTIGKDLLRVHDSFAIELTSQVNRFIDTVDECSWVITESEVRPHIPVKDSVELAFVENDLIDKTPQFALDTLMGLSEDVDIHATLEAKVDTPTIQITDSQKLVIRSRDEVLVNMTSERALDKTVHVRDNCDVKVLDSSEPHKPLYPIDREAYLYSYDFYELDIYPRQCSTELSISDNSTLLVEFNRTDSLSLSTKEKVVSREFGVIETVNLEVVETIESLTFAVKDHLVIPTIEQGGLNAGGLESTDSLKLETQENSDYDNTIFASDSISVQSDGTTGGNVATELVSSDSFDIQIQVVDMRVVEAMAKLGMKYLLNDDWVEIIKGWILVQGQWKQITNIWNMDNGKWRVFRE